MEGLSFAKAKTGYTDIEKIEDRREKNPTMDAIYFVSPQEYVVECIIADLDARRYKKSFLLWTAVLDPQLRRKVDSSPSARSSIGGFETLSLDFFPRESHVVTFRDPWSFPVLYHPACNGLVAKHMRELAQKVRHIHNRKSLCSLDSREDTRLPASVWPLENSPKCGITDRKHHFMRPVFSAHIWRGSYQRSWMNT